MDDIGITPQQFEDACAKGTQGGITLRFDQVYPLFRSLIIF